MGVVELLNGIMKLSFMSLNNAYQVGYWAGYVAAKRELESAE